MFEKLNKDIVIKINVGKALSWLIGLAIGLATCILNFGKRRLSDLRVLGQSFVIMLTIGKNSFNEEPVVVSMETGTKGKEISGADLPAIMLGVGKRRC